METEEKAPPLPAGYNENVLVLLAQSPNVVFTYLELSESFWGALAQNGRPALRLYDVTGVDTPTAPVTEVALPPFTTNWYFQGLAAGRTYAAELGWQDGGGLFVSLLRSNPAATPANERVWTQARKKMGAVLDRPPGPVLSREGPEETMGGLPTSYSL